MSGQPYLCRWKNRPRFTSPNTEKANRKLTAEISLKPPRRRDLAMTPHSSRLQVQWHGYRGCGKDSQGADEAGSGAICACARYGADPGTPNAPDSRQAAAVSVVPGGQTSRTKMHTCQYKTANGTCRRQMRCARSHRRHGNGEDKSRVTKCEMRSCLTDNGNHVSLSRSNENDTYNPSKSGNLDAERSARMADRHLPGALNFAEGLTALHGIEAEPECR